MPHREGDGSEGLVARVEEVDRSVLLLRGAVTCAVEPQDEPIGAGTRAGRDSSPGPRSRGRPLRANWSASKAWDGADPAVALHLEDVLRVTRRSSHAAAPTVSRAAAAWDSDSLDSGRVVPCN